MLASDTHVKASLQARFEQLDRIRNPRLPGQARGRREEALELTQRRRVLLPHAGRRGDESGAAIEFGWWVADSAELEDGKMLSTMARIDEAITRTLFKKKTEITLVENASSGS